MKGGHHKSLSCVIQSYMNYSAEVSNLSTTTEIKADCWKLQKPYQNIK